MKLLAKIFLATALILWSSPIFGQTTFATITGIVTDSSGAIVPGVTVTAVHLASNYHYDAVTNDSGQYTLTQLREGPYTLKAQLAGFKEFVVQLRLATQDLRRIDIRLEVGELESSIEVAAGATLIETETARVSDTKDANLLKSLPLNTRQLWDFLGLTPGILQAGAGSDRKSVV